MRKNVWFISDTHFGHVNSAKYSALRREGAGITLDELYNRDKEDKETEKELTDRLDSWLIKKWNSTIAPDDTIYIVGDFCLSAKPEAEKLLKKLHGKKWLIRGNHDKTVIGLEKYFSWVGDRLTVKFHHNQYPFIKEGERFCVELFHYPISTWFHKEYGYCHVCGHVHSADDKKNKVTGELRVDVGLDAELSGGEFISLEKLYNHFRKIVTDAGFDTFQEYADYMEEKEKKLYEI